MNRIEDNSHTPCIYCDETYYSKEQSDRWVKRVSRLSWLCWFKSRSSGLWRRVVLYCIVPQHYTASQPRRPPSKHGWRVWNVAEWLMKALLGVTTTNCNSLRVVSALILNNETIGLYAIPQPVILPPTG